MLGRELLPRLRLTSLGTSIRKWRLGFVLIALVLLARALGLLENLELLVLDIFLKARPAEATDAYITIVAIDKPYFEAEGKVESQKLYDLLQAIYRHQPAVVGLDVFLDSFSEPEQQQFVRLFQEKDNLVGVEKIIGPDQVAPLLELTPDQISARIGFNDFPIDGDGKIRRAFLGLSPDGDPKNFRESFALKLARFYLERDRNLILENGVRDPDAMRFGDTEIPRVKRHFGGYVRHPADGIQTLVNYRMGPDPFPVISASDLMAAQKFDPELMQNRIVVVGFAYYGRSRTVPTIITLSPILNNLGEYYYFQDPGKGQILGIEFQAHAISQLIYGTLENRTLLWSIPTILESFLIAVLGIVGFFIGRPFHSTGNNLILLVVLNTGLWTGSYGVLLFTGLWLPILPVFIAFSITGLTSIAFYQSERSWQALVREREYALRALKTERQITIEKAFSAIHAGPLQTLSGILRNLRDGTADRDQLIRSLEFLNHEIRDVGEHLREEAIAQENSLYLQRGVKLDMTHPLHELFYEVYNATLSQDFPGFRNIKVRTVAFDPIEPEPLQPEIKGKLCRFLAEALCNVGKHAEGTTRLSVTGIIEKGHYTLQVIDNGPGILSTHQGHGTELCYDVEKHLKGSFSRSSLTPKGAMCKLRWPISSY